jgi:hypothetical protein
MAADKKCTDRALTHIIELVLNERDQAWEVSQHVLVLSGILGSASTSEIENV